MCRVCYGPSLSCAEFAMCRVVHNSKSRYLWYCLLPLHLMNIISGFPFPDSLSEIQIRSEFSYMPFYFIICCQNDELWQSSDRHRWKRPLASRKRCLAVQNKVKYCSFRITLFSEHRFRRTCSRRFFFLYCPLLKIFIIIIHQNRLLVTQQNDIHLPGPWPDIILGCKSWLSLDMAEAIRTTVVLIRILIRTTVVPIRILIRTTEMWLMIKGVTIYRYTAVSFCRFDIPVR